MKSRTAKSILLNVAAVSLLAACFTAQAELVIQNAQYKPEKEALYVKGKVDAAAIVYVVDSASNQLIASVSTKGNQYRADISISENAVPCMVQIQTNEPGGGSWWGGANTDPGDFNVATVRHAPDRCPF